MENSNNTPGGEQNANNDTATNSSTPPNKPTQSNIADKPLEEQVAHYKGLFTKCKSLIRHYEEEAKKKEETMKNLKNKLAQYEGEEGKSCECYFRFKYDNICFYFFKSEKSYFFLSEKLLDDKFKETLNSNSSIKTYDFVKDIKSKDETISQIINQYEDKMQRLSNENENNEKRILTMNEKMKKFNKEMDDLRSNFENEKSDYEQAIKDIIQVNSEIFFQMKNTLEIDLTDDSLQDEVYNKIKETINEKLVNPSSIEETSKWLLELRSHLKRNLLSFLDIIFGRISLDKNYSAQKLKWQNTLDQIALSHEEELNKSIKIAENYKMQIMNLNSKISNLEQEKYNIAKQKDQTIDILSKELNKGVNINYLRNVFISYLTTREESIQDGLLPVIFTALQFNDSEIKKIQETRGVKKTNSGILGLFGSK